MRWRLKYFNVLLLQWFLNFSAPKSSRGAFESPEPLVLPRHSDSVEEGWGSGAWRQRAPQWAVTRGATLGTPRSALPAVREGWWGSRGFSILWVGQGFRCPAREPSQAAPWSGGKGGMPLAAELSAHQDDLFETLQEWEIKFYQLSHYVLGEF